MKTLIFPSEFIDNRGGVPQSTISIVKGLSHFSEFKIIVVCPNGSENVNNRLSLECYCKDN